MQTSLPKTPSLGLASQAIVDFRPIALSTLPVRPLFSILIANFNYGRYLTEALDSLLKQSYSNFEAIVCDDGSTDNSVRIVREFAARDPRIRLIPKENGGVASALNVAYADAVGELIAILDADDTFRPRKLEKMLEAFRSAPQAGLCVHPVTPISAAGRQIAPPIPECTESGWLGPTALQRGGISSLPPASGLTFRREAVRGLFPLPTHVRRGLDYLLCQTVQFYTAIVAVPEALADYRIHDANLTGSVRPDVRTSQKTVEDLEVVLPLQREFLARQYGPEMASALHLDDNSAYWESLLTIRVLSGAHLGRFRPFTDRQMISRIPHGRRKRIWRALALMPSPLGRRALGFWSRFGSLKRWWRDASYRPAERWKS